MSASSVTAPLHKREMALGTEIAVVVVVAVGFILFFVMLFCVFKIKQRKKQKQLAQDPAGLSKGVDEESPRWKGQMR